MSDSETAALNEALFLSCAPGATRQDAALYLEMSNGDPEIAAALFCAAQESMKSAPKQPPPPKKTAPGPVPKKGVEWFTGGHSGSGQAVLSRDPRGPTLAESVLSQAKEKGQQMGGDDSAEPKSFEGGGRRVGYLPGPSPPVTSTRQEQRTVHITFYKNGFQVDSGPLRRMDDPRNVEFLEAINNQMVPAEINKMYPKAVIDVELEDRREEDFVQQFQAFSGQGHTLGGKNDSPAPAQSYAPQPLREYVVDNTKPSGTLMLQLLDGQREEVHFNVDIHTVLDLRSLASSKVPSPPPQFDLVLRSGLSTKVLSDFTQMLSSAGCDRSLVMMQKR